MKADWVWLLEYLDAELAALGSLVGDLERARAVFVNRDGRLGVLVSPLIDVNAHSSPLDTVPGIRPIYFEQSYLALLTYRTSCMYK